MERKAGQMEDGRESQLIIAPLLSLPDIRRNFGSFSIENQFLLIASFVVFGLMAALSFFTANRIERAALEAVGAAGRFQMQTFIAPLVTRMPDGAYAFDDVFRQRLVTFLENGQAGQRVRNFKVWQPGGELVFSWREAKRSPGSFDELDRASAGKTVVSKTEILKHDYSRAESKALLIEVYAPLLTGEDGKVLYVGEIYEESETLQSYIASARIGTAIVVFLVSVPMLALLYFIVRRCGALLEEQRRTLRQSLRSAIDLSIENNRFRLIAENARIEAGKHNERVLDQIGADLHDGSVQVLTLAKLRLSDLVSGQSGLAKAHHQALERILLLTSGVLDDIRNISAGLVLPELEDASLEDAIHESVKRYYEITGCEVTVRKKSKRDLAITDLSICLYRFVLEGLMNSYRHAPNNRQLVQFSIHQDKLYVCVADCGRRPPLPSQKEAMRARLGKTSQKRRIRSFGGRVRYFPRKNGTIAIACLPLDSA